MKKILENKVALITGASRGIGSATASLMAANGAKVIINFKSNTKAAELTAEEISKAGGTALLVQADVSKESDVEKLFETAITTFGTVDILVNNAGVMLSRQIADVSLADYEKIMTNNVTSVFLMLRKAAKVLASNGSIINLSSTVTRTMFPGYGPYCASKAAVEQLTRIFAKEIGARGINVNSVSPGPTETELFLEGKSGEQIKRLADSSAFSRLGTPSDIARVIVYLASDEAKWISGQNIGANGAMA